MSSANDEHRREPERREPARRLRAELVDAGIISPGVPGLTRFRNIAGAPLTMPLDDTARARAEKHMAEGAFGRRELPNHLYRETLPRKPTGRRSRTHRRTPRW